MDSSREELYFPLYKGWVFEEKPLFRDPFHALCWQYWNICRDGLNYYWVDSIKVPKWHKCVGVVSISSLVNLRSYHKNDSLWKAVLNKFFSKVDILDGTIVDEKSDILISNLSAYHQCCAYFSLPDYQRSIRSTIKNGSICGVVDMECWSKLRIYKGIPRTVGSNGLIDIGCIVKSKIKGQSRSPGKYIPFGLKYVN